MERRIKRERSRDRDPRIDRHRSDSQEQRIRHGASRYTAEDRPPRHREEHSKSAQYDSYEHPTRTRSNIEATRPISTASSSVIPRSRIRCEPPLSAELLTPHASKYGFLRKQADNQAGKWKEYYFLLRPTTYLYYYETPKDMMPRGIIDLTFLKDVRYNSACLQRSVGGSEHCFRISGHAPSPIKEKTRLRPLYLDTKTSNEAKEWMDAILNHRVDIELVDCLQRGIDAVKGQNKELVEQEKHIVHVTDRLMNKAQSYLATLRRTEVETKDVRSLLVDEKLHEIERVLQHIYTEAEQLIRNQRQQDSEREEILYRREQQLLEDRHVLKRHQEELQHHWKQMEHARDDLEHEQKLYQQRELDLNRRIRDFETQKKAYVAQPTTNFKVKMSRPPTSTGGKSDESSTSTGSTTSTQSRPDVRGWVRRESRSQPGEYYYVHEKTGKTAWIAPQEDTIDEDEDEMIEEEELWQAAEIAVKNRVFGTKENDSRPHVYSPKEKNHLFSNPLASTPKEKEPQYSRPLVSTPKEKEPQYSRPLASTSTEPSYSRPLSSTPKATERENQYTRPVGYSPKSLKEKESQYSRPLGYNPITFESPVSYSNLTKPKEIYGSKQDDTYTSYSSKPDIEIKFSSYASTQEENFSYVHDDPSLSPLKNEEDQVDSVSEEKQVRTKKKWKLLPRKKKKTIDLDASPSITDGIPVKNKSWKGKMKFPKKRFGKAKKSKPPVSPPIEIEFGITRDEF